jgi:hypothetical protein
MGDLEVFGFVIYTGSDQGGNQISGAFGGSDRIKDYINGHAVQLRPILDFLTTTLKYVWSPSSTTHIAH